MTAPTTALARHVDEALVHAAKIKHVTGRELAFAAGLSQRTWWRRRTTGDWTLPELEALATYLDLSVPDLLAGPAHVVALLCAARDSNPEPADYDAHHSFAMTA